MATGSTATDIAMLSGAMVITTTSIAAREYPR
jgi:hypothetical protein